MRSRGAGMLPASACLRLTVEGRYWYGTLHDPASCGAGSHLA